VVTQRHVVVVGAGVAGATAAWYLNRTGQRVTIYEAEAEVGGQLRAKTMDEFGLLYEPHGPHIFHTSNPTAYKLVSSHCRLNDYQHRVLTEVEPGHYLTWPLQVNELKKTRWWPLISAELNHLPATPVSTNLETYAISIMGSTLYELFVAGYTRKQWGREPAELSCRFAPKRLVLRNDDDPRMFRDPFQGWCVGGWQNLVQGLLADQRIEVQLTRPVTINDLPNADGYVITAPLDEFLRAEPLQWRGIISEPYLYPISDRKLKAGVVNQPSPDTTATRLVETKWMSGQEQCGTIVVHEFPGAPLRHYPVDDEFGFNRARHRDLVRELHEIVPNAVLAGRLANYVYIDIDQAVMQGLAAGKRLLRFLSGDQPGTINPEEPEEIEC